MGRLGKYEKFNEDYVIDDVDGTNKNSTLQKVC